MANLSEILKRAIVLENRDPKETFESYFGQCRAMFKFCRKPATQWTGNDVKIMQELCGHEDVNTTMGYNHADRARGFSPMDVALSARPSVVKVPLLPQISLEN